MRDISSIRDYQPDKILISPGPGRPENSGLTLEDNKGIWKFNSDTWGLFRDASNLLFIRSRDN